MGKPKFYLETFGCQMNVNDSERVSTVLAARGYEATARASEADLVLLNTCSVRAKAAAKVYSRVGELKRVARGDRTIFGVIGCVAQDEAEAIFRKSQLIRLVLGPRSIGRLPRLLDQLEAGYPRAIDVAQDVPSDFGPPHADARINRFTGFVSIIEGCNKNCSFCIVPYTRGRENSRRPDSILAELDALQASGYKEVCLLGQNVNSYRYVTANGEISFANLLEIIAKHAPGLRVKFTTSYPRDFTAALVNVLAEYKNLGNWVHLPAQSGSDYVLRRMYRQYTRAQYLTRIRQIKECGRELSITGDMIVGFPGEREEDFQATLSLLDEVEYDNLYCFAYSPRPHTAAVHFPGAVADEVKRERLRRLIEHQAKIQKSRYQRYLGRTLEVLVEGRSAHGGQLTGHSSCHRVVNFVGPDHLAGEMVRVKIRKANDNSLFGEL